MKYKTDDEIRRVIKTFEDGTISRDAWGHPEHLVVAFHYSKNSDFESAYERMKTGIFKLLNAFGVDITEEMPYHETMTVFWMKTVFEYAATNPEITVESVNEMIRRFDKHYPGRFYTNELLMSDKARAEYVEPDIDQTQTDS